VPDRGGESIPNFGAILEAGRNIGSLFLAIGTTARGLSSATRILNGGAIDEYHALGQICGQVYWKYSFSGSAKEHFRVLDCTQWIDLVDGDLGVPAGIEIL
jgi:hypothetical protein